MTPDERSLLEELDAAVRFSNDERVASILGTPAGARLIHCFYCGRTPLHSACECGSNASTVRLLLSHGADANARTTDGCGRTPLVRRAAL